MGNTKSCCGLKKKKTKHVLLEGERIHFTAPTTKLSNSKIPDSDQTRSEFSPISIQDSNIKNSTLQTENHDNSSSLSNSNNPKIDFSASRQEPIPAHSQMFNEQQIPQPQEVFDIEYITTNKNYRITEFDNLIKSKSSGKIQKVDHLSNVNQMNTSRNYTSQETCINNSVTNTGRSDSISRSENINLKIDKKNTSSIQEVPVDEKSSQLQELKNNKIEIESENENENLHQAISKNLDKKENTITRSTELLIEKNNTVGGVEFLSGKENGNENTHSQVQVICLEDTTNFSHNKSVVSSENQSETCDSQILSEKYRVWEQTRTFLRNSLNSYARASKQVR